MIKNHKQAESTRRKIVELKEALKEFEAETTNKNSAKYRLGINSFGGLIKDLEEQIDAYESLVSGKFFCKKPVSLENISDILVSARLAQDLTHKSLGEKLGLKEQQIQRYEATDYETASLSKVIEVAMALNLKFYFERILILNGKSFDYPENYSTEKIKSASEKVKKQGLLAF